MVNLLSFLNPCTTNLYFHYACLTSFILMTHARGRFSGSCLKWVPRVANLTLSLTGVSTGSFKELPIIARERDPTRSDCHHSESHICQPQVEYRVERPCAIVILLTESIAIMRVDAARHPTDREVFLMKNARIRIKY